MGKNKRAAKAAWRAAAAAAIAASTTSPAPSLVAPVTAHATTTAAIDSKDATPAPTPQPHNVHTQNACPARRVSSLAPHTASASSDTGPTPRNNPPPPFATACEPQKPPAATKRDSREDRSPAAQPVPPTTVSTSHTHIATTHDIPAQPRVHTSARTPAKEPADTTHDASSACARTRPHAISTASHSTTTTAHDSRMTPDHTIQPSAAETESEKGPEPCEDEVDTVRVAHGGEPHTVRTPAVPSSRARAATVHTRSTPHGHPTTPSARERERATRPAPATLSPMSHTIMHDPHDVPAPPSSTTHAPATEDESRRCGEARDDEAHAPHTRNATLAPPSVQSTAPSALPNVSARNATVPPTPGLEPGGLQEAAAHVNMPPRPTSILADADPAIFDPMHLEEVVAAALRKGHAAGLKEGRNVGFREGLEAGKRSGRAEGHKEGLQEGLERGRLEARQEEHTAALPVSSIEAIDEKLLRDIRFDAYNSGFGDGLTVSDRELEFATDQARSAGYAEGCEEESRRWQDQRREAQSEYADAQTQTQTTVPLISHMDALTQTCPPPANNPPLASFSWADEADSLPIHPAPPLPAPRDFSVLRSSSRSPFGSLQRRARRFHRSDLRPPRFTFPSVPVITRRHPAGLRADRPSIMQVSSPSSSLPVPPLPLSWDGDPRLVELSRVLQSLGWVRESSA